MDKQCNFKISMNRPIRVLMIVPSLTLSNGVASFAMNYYRCLDHEQIKMDFVCYSDGDSSYIREIEDAGDLVYILPPIRKTLSHIKKCREIISFGKYDIVHDNSLLVTYPLMRLTQNKIGIRIFHSHNSKLGETKYKEIRNRIFIKLLLKAANQYAACSSQAGKMLFGNESFEIIPNVIDTNNFSFDENIRSSVREKEKVSEKKVIGAVGRLAYQKNPFFAFKVIEELLRIREDVVFWWVGDGDIEKEAYDYINEKKLDNVISLMGSRSDVCDLYQAFDLFFLPSMFEGLGIVCIEAQAAGLPCVVSSGFPAEVDVTGNVTFISITEDPSFWAKVISEKMDEQTDRIAGKSFVDKSQFSCSRSEKALSQFYYKLINDSQRN